jgi:hypothetical protein
MLCWLHRIALVASVGRDIARGRRAAGEGSDFAAIGCSRLTDVAHPAKFTKWYPAWRGFLASIMRIAPCEIGSPSTIPA